jgi:hypothetical protein
MRPRRPPSAAPRPPSAAPRPIAAGAALAAALLASAGPASAAIARDDCLVEVPERREARPPARKRPGPSSDARPLLRVADRTPAHPATPVPATMRKVPIDCPPRPEREIQAQRREPEGDPAPIA